MTMNKIKRAEVSLEKEYDAMDICHSLLCKIFMYLPEASNFLYKQATASSVPGSTVVIQSRDKNAHKRKLQRDRLLFPGASRGLGT